MVDIKPFQAPKLEKQPPAKLVSEGAPTVSRTPKGQNWLVVAMARDRQGNSAPNYLGAFDDEDECKLYVDDLQKAGYVQFDLFWVKMNHFLVWPPPLFTTYTEYHQEGLKQLMTNHNREVEQAERKMDQRVHNVRLENKLFESRRKSSPRKAGDAEAAIAKDQKSDLGAQQASSASNRRRRGRKKPLASKPSPSSASSSSGSAKQEQRSSAGKKGQEERESAIDPSGKQSSGITLAR